MYSKKLSKEVKEDAWSIKSKQKLLETFFAIMALNSTVSLYKALRSYTSSNENRNKIESTPIKILFFVFDFMLN